MLVVCAAVWRRNLDRELLRSRQLGRVADDAGWSFSTDDVFDYANLGFALFAWRPGGRASNVLVGRTPDGQSVCAFDYRAPDPEGRNTARFTCVLTDLGGTWPRVVVQPREQARRWPSLDVTLLDALPPTEAHSAFRVWTADPTVGYPLLASPLGDWLEATWPDAQFELHGSLLLVWGNQRSPRRIHELVQASDALRTRLPTEMLDSHRALGDPGNSR